MRLSKDIRLFLNFIFIVDIITEYSQTSEFVKWYLLLLICISLMINDIERLFMCMSSLEKCLFVYFLHFYCGKIY